MEFLQKNSVFIEFKLKTGKFVPPVFVIFRYCLGNRQLGSNNITAEVKYRIKYLRGYSCRAYAFRYAAVLVFARFMDNSPERLSVYIISIRERR